MEKKPKIIIYHQSLYDGVMSDVVTFCTITGLIGLGWLIGSFVMECLGAFMAMISIISRASGTKYRHTAYSIEDAYRILDMLDEDAQEGGL